MITMFTGVYTVSWSAQDFQQCVTWCRKSGVDRLAVKVADGTNVWYQSLEIGHNLLKNLLFPVVPYVYIYGGQNLSAEIALCKSVASLYGAILIDAESEWDNHPEYAEALANSGIKNLSMTTWANPRQHAWLPSITTLLPVVEEWVPQAYYNQLYDTMIVDYPTKCKLSPALAVDFPGETNTFVELARRTGETNDDLYVWHYASARASTSFSQAVSAYEVSKFPTRWMVKSAQDEWNASRIVPTPPYTTAIAEAWQARVFADKHPGPATSAEYPSVDWNGFPIVAQQFDFARAEYQNGKCRWFGPEGELT